MGSREFLGIFTQLARITSLTSLEEVLQKVILEVPELMNATGCSVYLIPDIIPTFDETLIRDGIVHNYNDISEQLIVLAATSKPEVKDLVGKAFYKSGEGITGWVYKHKIPLNIEDTQNEAQLKEIAQDLYWSDLYGENRPKPTGREKVPLLIVPLVVSDRFLGAIKFSNKQHHFAFSPLDEKIALLVAQIVSYAIQKVIELTTQKTTILGLLEIGAKRNLEEIMIDVSKSFRSMLHSEKIHIYIQTDDTNSNLSLWIENGKRFQVNKLWSRGHGFVGWVYKTGKPLIIEDTRLFIEEQELTDELLEKITDSSTVNAEDRRLKRQEPYSIPNQHWPITFLAIPIKQDDEVLGVLSAQSRYGQSFSRTTPFSEMDFQLAESFARIISNSIESDQEKILNELLTSMGTTSDLQKLYSLVTNRISKIVSSSGCSIFEYKKDEQGQYLKLAATKRKCWVNEGEHAPVIYRLGEGKTGYCGMARSTLIVNHYGSGELSEMNMDNEMDKITLRSPGNFTDRLYDENKLQVGIIQLKTEKDIDEAAVKKFYELRKTQRTTSQGLPFSKEKQFAIGEGDRSWSFVAIPIQDENDLMGVITLGRPVQQNPFSYHDITIIEAIAGRLATVIGNIRMLEQRQELFMSLAHEINTPLTGVLAESENLMTELEDQPDLSKLARDNLEQVLRLHLLTETIMGVLSNRVPIRDFKIVNIGDVLKKACKLFESEAAHKGCNILEPRSVDGPFPDIEMSEFDLLIALKNIVHNAVKYSFQPTPHQEKRYVKVWGGYADFQKKIYKINIQNFGVGILKDEIENRKIFEPYYRGVNASDRRRTGAGFGLAYARRIIEDLHWGRIDVSSIPQGGEAYLTTFSIILPIYQK